MSWLPGHQHQPLHAQHSTAQQGQHSTAQPAQHEAAAAAQLPYDDVISSSPMPLARQEEVVAAHLIVKAAGSGDTVHYDLVKQTGQNGLPNAPTFTREAHPHTEGDTSACLQPT